MAHAYRKPFPHAERDLDTRLPHAGDADPNPEYENASSPFCTRTPLLVQPHHEVQKEIQGNKKMQTDFSDPRHTPQLGSLLFAVEVAKDQTSSPAEERSRYNLREQRCERYELWERDLCNMLVAEEWRGRKVNRRLKGCQCGHVLGHVRPC